MANFYGTARTNYFKVKANIRLVRVSRGGGWAHFQRNVLGERK